VKITSDLLFVDFETKSLLNLETVGLAKYARSSSTKPLMLGYALNDGPVQLWVNSGPFPSDLLALLKNPGIKKVAWNSSFEKNIFRFCLGITIPDSEWIDPMIYSRNISLPGSLEEVGEILGIPAEEAKHKTGEKLIKMFCEPYHSGGKETLFGLSDPVFHTSSDKPAEWEQFCEYCKQDVSAERKIFKLVKTLPLPESEQRGWLLDQKINEAGMPINAERGEKALRLAIREKEEINAEQKKITGLENPNSPAQMLEWAKTEGYPFHSIGKPFVNAAIAGELISNNCRRALELRKKSSKISYKKLEVLHDQHSDGRLKHLFSYLGAARSGRWAGYGYQFQNQPRPIPEVEKNIDLALALIDAEDYDGIKKNFPSVTETVTSCLRSMFEAPPGKVFAVSDLNAIENRVLGWVSGCDAILKIFRDKLDPYKVFATLLYKISYSEVTKEQRQIVKPVVLGCGFGLSGGEEKVDKFKNTIHTGLWGYAEQYGVKMTQKEAHAAVKIFRQNFKEVCDFWYALDAAATGVLKGYGPITVGFVTFDIVKRKNGQFILRIKLPSGRYLHYMNARIETRVIEGAKGSYEKESILYDGIGHGVGAINDKHIWGPTYTYGGKLTENIVQAIARDILLYHMTLLDNMGAEITGHNHDECIIVTDDSSLSVQLEDMIEVMSTSPEWALDLPLSADGYTAKIYKKA